MATYAPIATGYVDEGPLGALWAGQNANAQRQQNEMSNLADLMDMLTKGQTFDQTARMDPERLRQLQFTNTGLDLGNQLAAGKLPNELLMSNEQGRMSDTRLKTPGWFEKQVAGGMAEAEGKVTDQQYKAGTLPGRIAGENVVNQGKQVDYANSLLPSMRGMTEMQMVDFMQSRNVAPDVAGAYLEIIRGRGGIDKLLDNMSRTPATVAAERLQAQKDSADLKRANISAGAMISSAEKNAQAAISAGNKNALAAVLGQTKSLADQLKMQLGAIENSMDGYKPEEKQSKAFKDMLAAKKVLESRLEESNKLVEYVTANIVGYAPPPSPKAVTNPARQGKEGANPTSSGAIANAPAATTPPKVIKIPD